MTPETIAELPTHPEPAPADLPTAADCAAEPHSACASVADALIAGLAELGVRYAFGINGGGIAGLYHSIATSSIRLIHCRHEAGAGYQATEAALASDRPTLVFATTGPGLLNSLTAVAAARWEGAKLVLVSGCTNPEQRGRAAVQETSSYTLPQDAFYAAGPFFDFAVRMEHQAELPHILGRLALGFSRPGGFVAHVSLPMRLQQESALPRAPLAATTLSAPCLSSRDLAAVAHRLRQGPFAIWVGFGARAAAPLVRRVAERSGAAVISSPRGKGIMPEDHPLFAGVAGLGGDPSVQRYLCEHRPSWLLVLGTRLGEPTSFWDPSLLPTHGVIHVDIDPTVPGSAYPDSGIPTIGIQADVGCFLEALLELPIFPMSPGATRTKLLTLRSPRAEPPGSATGHGVRPRALMTAVQRHVVDGADAWLMAEAGNAFAWATACLRFQQPRYRVSTRFGAMGHFTCGVVGAALACGRKAVALVGDGAMLMHSEVNSAASHGAPAVWIVLNDAGYGMSLDGARFLGLSCAELTFPRVDFAKIARAMGGDGVRVESEDELDAALGRAMGSALPFVVDVWIRGDSEPSPLLARFESLRTHGTRTDLPGWPAEQTAAEQH